ncbi:AAT-domain-containing protein [Coleophoma cylindrospora]|uniref:AAT-domain-containing protein n=1 Tax=Coleophoma cylindrospora TaxID=1849047 RepID=A0A3D8RMM8_9HELO|nr:AAT-domain-containing protein [Coleophoma cylindrospora]
MPSKAPEYEGPERINLSGSPREIGVQHGKVLSQKIRNQIAVYTDMFLSTSGLSWSSVQTLASEYGKTVSKLTPDLYEEMLGIAEGADLDILDIVALNCRSEIALGHFSDGCTSLGWDLRKANATGTSEAVLLAQNWDWTARVKKNLVLMSIEQQGKPKIWMVTEAGIVGKIGFNSASVGTNLNAIRAKPTDSSKLPIHVILRVCLESASVSAAISKIEDLGGIASSAHILIADPTGPRSLELSPKGNVYIDPNSNGIVCHTNHFIQNRYVNEPPWLAGSPIRLERAQKLTGDLATGPKAVTGDALRKHVFSDLFNAPQAICCQEDPTRPVETRSSTLFCIVMKFQQGHDPAGEVVWGRPGSGEEGEVLTMPW